MNAVERIEAAIERLEARRDASTRGRWEFSLDPFSESVAYVIGSSEAYELASDLIEEDADLIVTLHRTIDAQLAILREAHRFATHRYAALFTFPYIPSDWNAVALADAILGAPDDR